MKNNSLSKKITEIFFSAIICGIMFSLMRIQEAYFLDSKMYYQFDAIKYLVNTSFYDLKVCITFSTLLIPVVFIFKTLKKVLIAFFTLLILSNSILIKYFLSNFNLLGSEMFAFSYSETLYILKTEFATYGLFEYTLVFLYPILFIFFFYLFYKHILPKANNVTLKVTASIYIVFLLLTAYETQYFIPSYKSFKTYHQFIINNNKQVFYISDLIKKNTLTANEKIKSNLKQDIKSYQKENSKFNYIGTEYPLMHNTPYQNVLGQYFKKDTTKPNIVFIMVEGLGSAFSGPKAHLGSFTPFIDSLITKSLYWENFLSNAERTYGVLPNPLSSAPYMKQFIQQKNYINHYSILNELSNEDYFTNFNYGGWANFSKREKFLEFNKIDKIDSDVTFDTTQFKIHKSTEDDFHWGYDDASLFQQYLLHSEKYKQPYFSLLLTLSMHSPWDVSHDYTVQKANDYIGDITEYQRELFQAQEEVVLTIIFLDQELKKFIADYKKRADFKNTIFFIFGDHNMHILPEKNEIDAFHVPFLIYSELLTKTKTFKGVSTHRDITPSILGLLENTYNMQFKEEKHWLGLSLDTSATYQNNQITPMILGSNSFVNFINKNNIVIYDEVFILDEDFNIFPETDSIKIFKTLKLYNEYQAIEKYMLLKDKLFQN